jgi:hypothetical protein
MKLSLLTLLLVAAVVCISVTDSAPSWPRYFYIIFHFKICNCRPIIVFLKLGLELADCVIERKPRLKKPLLRAKRKKKRKLKRKRLRKRPRKRRKPNRPLILERFRLKRLRKKLQKRRKWRKQLP